MRKLNTKSKFLALAGLISAASLVLGPARLASAQAAAPSWSFTGNLNAARSRHTATLLPNGKVLVEGGALTAGSSILTRLSTAPSFTTPLPGHGAAPAASTQPE
jgi:hypothetical protein